MKAALSSGAYASRSVIANAQRCINLFPEVNPGDAPFPTTHYPSPGLKLLATAPTGGWRCLYRTKSTGELFGVAGGTVYQILEGWSFRSLGIIGNALTPVSMSDNGFSVLIVDGTPNGYQIDLETKVFSTVSDPAFYGATRVDISDTYFILNRPGTQQFYISGSNTLTFDPLDIASKSSSPDYLQFPFVMSDNIWLVGSLTTEVWYNTGASDFTFGKIPGTFIEHGAVSPYSFAKYEQNGYWLAQNEQGKLLVLKANNLAVERISTHAIEAELGSYASTSDAIGLCFQQGGHVFYQLTFPAADRTWVWDEATKQWHERVWLDTDGTWHRHRANCAAYAFGLNLCGDWQNGNLYAFDLNTYTDAGSPILYLRSWPHLQEEGKRVTFRQFIADMETGTAAGTTTDNPPQVSLRWSDDRGMTWGDPVEQSLGSAGQYDTSLSWWGLGMSRFRVFELSWSCNTKTALNGAYIDAVAHKS